VHHDQISMRLQNSRFSMNLLSSQEKIRLISDLSFSIAPKRIRLEKTMITIRIDTRTGEYQTRV